MQLPIDRDKIQTICSRENIAYLGIFGSYARGEAQTKSDVDILVDFNDTKSYFELARVQEELENIFKKKVDLVLKTNIKESLKGNILGDLTTLYEKR